MSKRKSLRKQLALATLITSLSLSYSCQTPLPNRLNVSLNANLIHAFVGSIQNHTLNALIPVNSSELNSDKTPGNLIQLEDFRKDLEMGSLDEYYQSPTISFSFKNSANSELDKVLENITEITSRGLVYTKAITFEDGKTQTYKGQFFDGRFYFSDSHQNLKSGQKLTILFFDLNFNIISFDGEIQNSIENNITLANQALKQIAIEKNDFSITPEELEDQLLSGSEGSFVRGTFSEVQKTNLQQYAKAISRDSMDGASYRNKLRVLQLVNSEVEQ